MTPQPAPACRPFQTGARHQSGDQCGSFAKPQESGRRHTQGFENAVGQDVILRPEFLHFFKPEGRKIIAHGASRGNGVLGIPPGLVAGPLCFYIFFQARRAQDIAHGASRGNGVLGILWSFYIFSSPKGARS